MKYIAVFLTVILLASCQSNLPKSYETSILIKEDANIYMEDNILYIENGMTVNDVISFIESIDGSKQIYTGMTNSKTPKEKQEFFENEYLLVTSESGKYREYYAIHFMD